MRLINLTRSGKNNRPSKANSCDFLPQKKRKREKELKMNLASSTRGLKRINLRL